MIDPTKTTPEKLAEMNDSLIVDNNYLRARVQALEAAHVQKGFLIVCPACIEWSDIPHPWYESVPVLVPAEQAGAI